MELSDYKDSPNYSCSHLEPTSNVPVQHPLGNITLDNTMRRANSEVFDKIGNLGNISEAQRINKMREHFHKLKRILVRSVQSTKYAICSIIEVTNRLGSLSVLSSNSNIQATAIDKALGRHQKHSLENASAQNYLKRKNNTALVDNKTVIAITSKKRKVTVKSAEIASKNHMMYIQHTMETLQDASILLDPLLPKNQV